MYGSILKHQCSTPQYGAARHSTAGQSTAQLSTAAQSCSTDGLQATVYDDAHLGDFISVIVQLNNRKTEYAAGGVSALQLHQYGNLKA